MTAPAVQQATVARRSWMQVVMGLPVSVTVRGPRARTNRAEEVVHALYADLRRADRTFSTYRADSEVSLLRSGALARRLVSPEMSEVLAVCERARTLTDGHFNANMPQTSGDRLFDPSGLVKGWAAEQASRALESLEGTDWLVNAGGDVLGRALHGPAWRVAVEDPRDRKRNMCVLPLQSGAVATSGTAARGRHILDPHTGRPVSPHLLSATVVGPSLMWADVLATAAFVEGPAAVARVTDLQGYEALLVRPDGNRIATRGLNLTERVAARVIDETL